ncbi:MAG: 3-carboxy-cis,cis-muconate cycloisomerase [Alphaproteobacteria bacterium HGW-Alphaproteobacteria-2]|nr:MAG: 3-carboxy-cis,cis-muconate cycloisomerase [Alphaproteobacteria bacterium HGW-Alphaproteobacteria-2]
MAASIFDSVLYRDLLHDAEVGALFSDGAELRAMLLVEGALAEAQGTLGLIPEASAAAIARAAREVVLDPGALARETAVNAVCVPALVAAFRTAMGAPEHAAWVHWGATSQDIIDTALMLRLGRLCDILDARLVALIAALGSLAERHAALPMAARTWGQAATPTSFGAVVAGWGWPVLRHRARLAALRPRLLCASLAGAAGTLAAMGPQGPEVERRMAGALGLGLAEGNWHAGRDNIAEFAGWLAQMAGSLAKMGEDLLILARSDVGEVRIGGGGGSSTMPQKQNPVAPSLIVALARFANAQAGAVTAALPHREARDAAAWITEWLALPGLAMAAARALALAAELPTRLVPQPARMAANIDLDGLGLIHAEALSFALARLMPRPEAQAAVKALCKQAQAEGMPLAQLVAARWPEHDLAAAFDPAAYLGTAPTEAHAFAAAARAG